MDPRDFSSYDINTGQIVLWGFGIPVTETGQNWIDGTYHGDQYWVSPMGIEERPDPIDPVLSGSTITFDGPLPETQVTVRNEAGEEMQFLVGDGPLTLSDSGRYWIEVDPPMPFHRRLMTVEIP
jgi:hypothetical protein